MNKKADKKLIHEITSEILNEMGSNTQTISVKGVTISGHINDLKDFVEQIGELASGEREELTNRFNDLLYSIETRYQSFHELDQDNWDSVH